jgi:hypothetical protein
MDKTVGLMLSRILNVFTSGFFVIAGVLAFMKVGDCGSVFDPSGACDDGQLAGRQALVVVFVGLGLTTLVAGVLMPIRSPDPDRPSRPDLS